jgi:hypothetical protein
MRNHEHAGRYHDGLPSHEDMDRELSLIFGLYLDIWLRETAGESYYTDVYWVEVIDFRLHNLCGYPRPDAFRTLTNAAKAAASRCAPSAKIEAATEKAQEASKAAVQASKAAELAAKFAMLARVGCDRAKEKIKKAIEAAEKAKVDADAAQQEAATDPSGAAAKAKAAADRAWNAASCIEETIASQDNDDGGFDWGPDPCAWPDSDAPQRSSVPPDAICFVYWFDYQAIQWAHRVGWDPAQGEGRDASKQLKELYHRVVSLELTLDRLEQAQTQNGGNEEPPFDFGVATQATTYSGSLTGQSRLPRMRGVVSQLLALDWS